MDERRRLAPGVAGDPFVVWTGLKINLGGFFLFFVVIFLIIF